MKKLKPTVLICLDSLELGGAERQAFYLSRYLKYHTDFNVEVIGFNNPGRVAELLETEDIKYQILSINFKYKKKYIIFSSIVLLLKLLKIKPKIIIPFTYAPNLLCGIIWKLSSSKICIWNQRDEGRRIRGSLLERIAIANATEVVSNSTEGKKFLLNKFPKLNHVNIIFNGIKPLQIKDLKGFNNNFLIEKDFYIVSMIANLHPYKDHLTLIKAWQIVVDSIKDKRTILLLAGRIYDQSEAVISLTNSLKLNKYVKFLGGIEDIPALLSMTNLAVFSSNHEGCPNAILEYMSASLPVVATDINGSKDALGEDYPFLVPPNSPEIFAKKILKLYHDPELALNTGIRNKDYVESKFNLDTMGNSYLEIINRNL